MGTMATPSSNLSLRLRAALASTGGAAAGGPLALGVALLALLLLLLLLLVPVPAPLLDLLLLLHFGAAAALVGTVFSRRHAAALPALPALLLLFTGLRLGLNLALLRAILRDGDAGQIVELVGGSLLSGDAATGIALLLGLGLGQYLIVARGGERMAEVAARFALDALPGQQAAIEADLRAGAIGAPQAQAQRAALLQRAQFYGAMDGALRFVRGDVVVGLLLALVGLLVGAFVGVSALGLSLPEAVGRYALLVAGQGLAVQVPVLLTTLAAAVLLGRTPKTDADRPALPPLPPVLLVRADPQLGVGAAELAAALSGLAQRLGIPLPAPALQPAAARYLELRLYGAHVFGRPLAPGEPPLPVLLDAIREQAPELLGIETVQRMLDGLLQAEPALVREVVPQRLDLPRLVQLLRRLLVEQVFPLPLRPVLEALAAVDPAELEKDPLLLAEHIRPRLGWHILSPHLGAAEDLTAVVVDAEIEELLREAGRGALGPGQEETLAVEPEIAAEIARALRQAQERFPNGVLLCQKDVRRHLVRMGGAGTLPVLAYSEVRPAVQVNVLGRIDATGLVVAAL